MFQYPFAAGITTCQLAQALAIRPQSIRKRYAVTGSYFSVVPVKMPNRQLRWPADSVQRLLGKGEQ